jgi:hypothetical protein
MAEVQQICASVATFYGLKPTPDSKWPPGITEYAKPSPLALGGFGGPSIVLSSNTASNLAVVTVNGAGSAHPNSIKAELAHELKDRLSTHFGADRIEMRDESWTDF